MIKPEELYDKTRLPANEELLDELIGKYLSISFEDMSRATSNLSDLLYKKINIVDDKTKNRFNQIDLDSLIAEINKDFNNAGRPFNPKLYNGITNPLGIMAGWNTFQSWNLLGTEKIHSNEISHRFYFGISNDKLYEFSKCLYEKLKKANIPFYFKTETNQYVERIDNLVLYTSTPLLEKTLILLDEIERKRPDLIASCFKPSILAGKLTDKIGYATEDYKDTTSYTDFICKTFVNVLGDELNKIATNNSLSQIKSMYEKKKQEYIALGKDISLKRVRERILFDILIKNDSNFKNNLLLSFRQKLSENGTDLENICFNKKVKEEIEQQYGINAKSIDFFSHEVQEKIITLPNGKKMTIAEYYRFNNLEYWVPLDSIVTFKNGRVISGRDFLNEAVSRLEKFNTWEELVMYYGIMIERNPRNTIKETNELTKSGYDRNLKEERKTIEDMMNNELFKNTDFDISNNSTRFGR